MMDAPAEVFQSLEEVRTLDQGPVPTFVVRLPEVVDAATGSTLPSTEVLAIPVLSRSSGILMALPAGSLPPEVAYPVDPPLPQALIGPVKEILVTAAADDEEGLEKPLDSQLQRMLVDFDAAILPKLRRLDPVTEGPGIHCFSAGDVDIFPSSQELLTATYAWIQEEQEGRVGYYSAMEELPQENPRAAPKQATAKAKHKAATVPKRVSTATLSQQLASLAESIPALSSSLVEMQKRQDSLEQALSRRPAAPPPAPHRLDFGQTGPSPKRVIPPPAKFLAAVGPPPKLRSPQKPQKVEEMPEDEPQGLLEELEDVPPEEQQHTVSQMLVKQQMALNTLVAHLASQDGLHDLGVSGSASSSISLKGSAKRERLLSDLAARRSDFFLKVAQNAHRRLKPAEAVPQALEEFPQKALFTKYLERQGGYTGYQREQGLTMWLLGHVADQMLLGDVKGAQEMLALAMVAIEQSAMDNGKWEIAWVLALQEDPPQQLFAHRPIATNPRLRAFSPLCPADWGAIALAYVKELDLLSSRRQEALQGGGRQEEDAADSTKKPKQPRYPRKPKAQGEQSSTETT